MVQLKVTVRRFLSASAVGAVIVVVAPAASDAAFPVSTATAANVATDGTARAIAAFPGRNGRIAYEAVPVGPRRRDQEVLTVNADGSGIRQVTHNKTPDYGPVWSPTGDRIAYQGTPFAHPSPSEIYTIRPDGTGRRQLTHTPYPIYNYRPTWSPNGKRIAYLRDIGIGGGVALFTMKTDGTGRRQITPDNTIVWSPAWSPDGKRIAYVEVADNGTDGEIFTIRPDGSGRRQITHNATQDSDPSWSPTGKRIVYTGSDRIGPELGDDLYTIGSDGSRRRQITHTLYRHEFYPVFSPNGKWIAYMNDELTGGRILYAIHRDGSGKPRMITNGEEPDWGVRVSP
jgi:Tol biopolymer transport system component